MAELIKAYEIYGDFNRELYFTTIYNVIPSGMELKLSLKESKENMEQVLALIDYKEFDLQLVLKNWSTSDHKNAELNEDYPYEYLFKSENRKLLVRILLDTNNLLVDFYYEANDSIVEKWILETNIKLRDNLGELKTPSFNILAKNRNGFYKQKINTKNFEQLDVNLLYNDDFKEIDQIITNSIQKLKSGLILLHGKPGTGKTTYIKNLISKFNDNSFMFIQNDLVPELLKPEFISFLLKNKNCILIIEDAEKVVVSRENENSSVASTILQLTDGLFSDYLNIRVICSFNTNLDKIDKALLRKGRLIARYEFRDLTIEKSNQLLKTLGYKETDKEMSIAEIYRQEDKDFGEVDKRRIGFN